MIMSRGRYVGAWISSEESQGTFFLARKKKGCYKTQKA
jgi:hypothetical protein